MNPRQDYKGCVILANLKQLADGSGWTEDYDIEIHYGDRVEVRPYFSDRKFATEDEAVAGSIRAAIRKIDRSPGLQVNPNHRSDPAGVREPTPKEGSSDWRDAEIPERLKATWDDGESYRPTVQSDALTVLHVEGRRRPSLEDLDGDSEELEAE